MATLQNETRCHQYQAWVGHSAKDTGVPEACHCLPTAQEAQQLKEPWVVCALNEADTQGVTRIGEVIFTRLMQILIVLSVEPGDT